MWYCYPKTDSEDVETGHDEVRFDEIGSEKIKILEKSLSNDWYVKDFVYIVLYMEDGGFLKCNCRSFESRGLLCAHILIVVNMKDMGAFHERYVIRRWRKAAHRRHARISLMNDILT